MICHPSAICCREPSCCLWHDVCFPGRRAPIAENRCRWQLTGWAYRSQWWQIFQVTSTVKKKKSFGKEAVMMTEREEDRPEGRKKVKEWWREGRAGEKKRDWDQCNAMHVEFPLIWFCVLCLFKSALIWLCVLIASEQGFALAFSLLLCCFFSPLIGVGISLHDTNPLW